MTDQTREEVFSRWRAMPVVDHGSVEVVGVLRSDGFPVAHWVECPCGGRDHYGYHPLAVYDSSSSPAEFITCFFHGRQFRVSTDAIGVIEGEERNYLDAVDRWESLVQRQRLRRRSMTDGEFIEFMHDTHGVERDFTAVWLDQNKEFQP